MCGKLVSGARVGCRKAALFGVTNECSAPMDFGKSCTGINATELKLQQVTGTAGVGISDWLVCGFRWGGVVTSFGTVLRQQ